MSKLQLQTEDITAPDNSDTLMKATENKDLKFRILKRSILCLLSIVILFGSLVGVCYVSPVAADTFKKIPGSIFYMFTDKRLIKAHDDGLTQIYDQQVTNGDVTIAIKEIYYDKSNLSIGIITENAAPSQFFYQIHYNNKLISGTYSGNYTEDTDGFKYELLHMPLNQTLPDPATIEFTATEKEGLKRQFAFDITLYDTNAEKQ